MRRARCSKQKIVDIFLYYMYIARVVPLFVEPITLVITTEGRTTLVSCANRGRLSGRVLKKKKKKKKGEESTIILYFGVNVNESARASHRRRLRLST